MSQSLANPLDSTGARTGLHRSISRLPAQLQGVDSKSILRKIELGNFQSSTKLEALLEELHIMQVCGVGFNIAGQSLWLHWCSMRGVCYLIR